MQHGADINRQQQHRQHDAGREQQMLAPERRHRDNGGEGYQFEPDRRCQHAPSVMLGAADRNVEINQRESRGQWAADGQQDRQQAYIGDERRPAAQARTPRIDHHVEEEKPACREVQRADQQ
jgi:hypothetical protein